jgi:hypothetical protein
VLQSSVARRRWPAFDGQTRHSHCALEALAYVEISARTTLRLKLVSSELYTVSGTVTYTNEHRTTVFRKSRSRRAVTTGASMGKQ